MVTRDVDDTRYERIEGPKGPQDLPRRPSKERPGYPRGIPGLREDEKPKTTPAAGKPSRPRVADETKK